MIKCEWKQLEFNFAKIKQSCKISGRMTCSDCGGCDK